MKMISISTQGISVEVALDDSPTAQAIGGALPLEGIVNRWGAEIYFEIPIRIKKAEEAREQVEVGEVGYWPPGHAFCIFFGKTPASQDERPRAASPVNVFGKVVGDPTVLRRVKDGSKITIEEAHS
ncbi:MAG: cyclophilin-like fold protein [Anaerolineales bacterium]|jgi:hypothetical protein